MGISSLQNPKVPAKSLVQIFRISGFVNLVEKTLDITVRPMHLRVAAKDGKRTKSYLTQFNVKPEFLKSGEFLDLFLPVKDIVPPEWTILCGGCSSCSSRSEAIENEKKNLSFRYKYAVYPPLVLLPTNSHSELISLDDAVKLAEELDCTHVAVNEIIKEDIQRHPQIKPVYGDFGLFVKGNPTPQDLERAFWCTARQNGITQTWAPMYTMFSRGNITEKKRVLETFALQNPIKDTTVVDLYAGIGYFTLSYMKNRPQRVLCWEINPWSVEGLVRGAAANGWSARVVREHESFVPLPQDQIVVFLEDNLKAPGRLKRLKLELAPISHINMGLLPDARPAWDTAVALAGLNPLSAKTVVHVHENIHQRDRDAWVSELETKFGRCLHVEKIKGYAPGVDHLCADLESNSPTLTLPTWST